MTGTFSSRRSTWRFGGAVREVGFSITRTRARPYASEDYQKLLAARGITCSMSRRGNCIDNAAMESWFSTLKCELGERFESYGRAKEELFDYIETFYNRRRRHSSLDYLSPVDFEQRGRETPAFDIAA
jgi:transposase InsO family protein